MPHPQRRGVSGPPWYRYAVTGGLLALAVLIGLIVLNRGDPRRVLAAGAEIALSVDVGRSWRSVLDLRAGAGPVAWSTSNPRLAYAVGFDHSFYRSRDGGESWQAVGKGS